MNNKIRTFSAIFLAVCAAATVFSACGSKPDKETTTAHIAASQASTLKVTTPEGSELIAVSQDKNYTYYMPPTTKSEGFSFADAPQTKHAPATAKAFPATTESKASTAATNKTTKSQESTTKRASSGGSIEEIAEGITVITKTTPVDAGNSATIMVYGTAGKKYTIEFYETESKKADYDGLTEKTADGNSFVSWTFKVENSCETGNRKIIIREKGSNNFVQTSITVK